MIRNEIKDNEKRVKNENKKIKKKIVVVKKSASKTFKKFRKSKKILIKNNKIKNSEIKNSENKKNTIKIVEEFKKSMSKINFKFIFYILKRISVKESKKSKNVTILTG